MSTTEQYQQRMKRIDEALAVKEPDRVPVIPLSRPIPLLIPATPWRRPCMIRRSCRTHSANI